jgi:flagellar biogenesis protein FliO
MPAGQMISLIIVVAFIFFAFWLRSFILKRVSGQSRGRFGRNVSVLENFAIARDKSFCLIEVAGKVYLVAFTSHTVTLLDTLDAAEFSESAAQFQDKNINSRGFSGPMSSKMPTGNSLYARMTRSLARFLAHRMGREDEFEAQFKARFDLPDDSEDKS